MKRLLLFCFVCLFAIVGRAADYALNKELTWDQVKSGTVSFALVSGSEVLYGSGDQNTGMAGVTTAVNDANGVSLWKVETVSGGFFFRGYSTSGVAYRIWGNDGYLNAQPSTSGVSFILGKTDHSNGQDMDNGAVWTVTSTTGGYYIRNVGNNAYLNGTHTSATADKVWKFYSVKESASEADPNFHIYLCFGQSNMEGNAAIEAVDKQNVPERFKMMAAVNFTNPARTMGQWYTATPPLCRQGTGLTPAGYFGRTMIERLPENVKVGVVHVAVGGAPIELFDEDVSQADGYWNGQADWYVNYCKEYDMNPYRRLINMAKEAQKSGVIKGILFHQGESNNTQQDWPGKVKKVYDRICSELSLNPAETPFLAGEMVQQDMGGVCWGHNAIIAKLPETIANAHVISSAGLPCRDDGLHFTAAGYRTLGERYANKMCDILGISYDANGGSGNADNGTNDGVDLTASMFHGWSGVDASATIATENVYGAYVLKESTGLPYGDGNVSSLNYADLSDYAKLEVTVTYGEPRFCFNRAENNGTVTIEFPRDNTSKPYETVKDNGDGSKTYTVDLEAIVAEAGYAHLNCIKGANWANVTVTSMKLIENDMCPSVEPIEEPIELAFTEQGSKEFDIRYFKVSGEGVSIDYNSGIVTAANASGKIYVEFNNANLSAAQSIKLDVAAVEPFADICNTGSIYNEGTSINAWYASKYNMQNLDGEAVINQEPQGYNWNEKMGSVTRIEWNISKAGIMKINALTITADAPSTDIAPDPMPGFLAGDMDGDGSLSIDDLTALINALKNNTASERGDVDGDGSVNVNDINALADILLGKEKWVATWASAQLKTTESNGYPPAIGLSGNSVRQIVQVSVGGKKLKFKLSNEFTSTPTEIKAVEIAVAKSSGNTAAVYDYTTRSLTFGGSKSITIQPGQMVESDPISFTLRERENVSITVHYGSCSNTDATGHPGSRTTSYIVSGNSNDFTSATRTEHWYNICAIDVVGNEDSRAVAILGNSITDGRGSTTNKQNRWTDVFSRSLLANEATKDVSVLNLGIGGNLLTGDGLGTAGYLRFDRDILQQAGVKYAILFIGTNDIGYSPNVNYTYDAMVARFTEMIDKAHAAGIKIYGATITPFKNSGHYSADHEKCRQRVNTWIRTCDRFDGVIDFDKTMQDPADTESMPQKYFMDGTDGLHANAEGYQLMGSSIDLNLFGKNQ